MKESKDDSDTIDNDYTVSTNRTSATSMLTGLLASLFCSCFASPSSDYMSSKSRFEEHSIDSDDIERGKSNCK